MIFARLLPSIVAAMLFFAGLFPLAVLAADQGSARWEARVGRYLEKDKAQSPAERAVVFAGSSSIDIWSTLKTDFPGISVVNRGISGTHLGDLPDYAGRLVYPLHPRILVVYAGDNDLADGRSVAEVVAAFERLRRQFYAAEPEARLVFISLKPSPRRKALLPQMREVNQAISALCQGDPQAKFVDVFTAMLDGAGEPRADLFGPDNLHMNQAGYRLWTSLVGPVIGPGR